MHRTHTNPPHTCIRHIPHWISFSARAAMYTNICARIAAPTTLLTRARNDPHADAGAEQLAAAQSPAGTQAGHGTPQGSRPRGHRDRRPGQINHPSSRDTTAINGFAKRIHARPTRPGSIPSHGMHTDSPSEYCLRPGTAHRMVEWITHLADRQRASYGTPSRITWPGSRQCTGTTAWPTRPIPRTQPWLYRLQGHRPRSRVALGHSCTQGSLSPRNGSTSGTRGPARTLGRTDDACYAPWDIWPTTASCAKRAAH
jgi:hypothetical protein